MYPRSIKGATGKILFWRKITGKCDFFTGSVFSKRKPYNYKLIRLNGLCGGRRSRRPFFPCKLQRPDVPTNIKLITVGVISGRDRIAGDGTKNGRKKLKVRTSGTSTSQACLSISQVPRFRSPV